MSDIQIRKIQIRRGTAAEWMAANTVLLSMERGIETDTKKSKLGDGVTGWNALPYDEISASDASLSMTDITTNNASAANHGFLKKLSGIATEFMNGLGDWVGLTKASVGLGNVDNTADADKPVSLSTQAALNSKVNNSAVGAVNGVASLDANGLVPITQMPPAVVERLVPVADQAARYLLTMGDAQNGDTVKEIDTGLFWYVVDQTNLNNSSGYVSYKVGEAASVPWSGVTGKPAAITNLSGTNTGDQTLGSLGAEAAANKDATGGYAGLTLFKLNLRNATGTITSWLTSAATVARTWVMQDRDGTVALTDDKPRVSVQSNQASCSVNSDTHDIVNNTGLTGAVTLNNPTGTPGEGQPLIYELTGTAARAISYGTAFESSTVALPSTTVTTAKITIAFMYNLATGKWRCVGVA